jgi:hypothetical protein
MPCLPDNLRRQRHQGFDAIIGDAVTAIYQAR